MARAVGNYLKIKQDLSYYTVLLSRYSQFYEANAEKLQELTTAEEKWNEAYEKAIDHTGGDAALKAGGRIWVEKDAEGVSEEIARQYADAKVKARNEALLLEVTEKDLEYETSKNMFESLVTLLEAEAEPAKQRAAAETADTGFITS